MTTRRYRPGALGAPLEGPGVIPTTAPVELPAELLRRLRAAAPPEARQHDSDSRLVAALLEGLLNAKSEAGAWLAVELADLRRLLSTEGLPARLAAVERLLRDLGEGRSAAPASPQAEAAAPAPAAEPPPPEYPEDLAWASPGEVWRYFHQARGGGAEGQGGRIRRGERVVVVLEDNDSGLETDPAKARIAVYPVEPDGSLAAVPSGRRASSMFVANLLSRFRYYESDQNPTLLGEALKHIEERGYLSRFRLVLATKERARRDAESRAVG